MNLLLQRGRPTFASTPGELTFPGAPSTFYTLEPPPGRSIPAGTYKVIVRESPRLGYETPRLLGVPGWPENDILIHIGNYPKDTEGCILVGLTEETDFVGSSREAFAQLYPKVAGAAVAGDLTITVEDATAA